MATTYCQYTRKAFELPEIPLSGRNSRLAFEHGFDYYVWTKPKDRTHNERNRRAHRRYRLKGLRECFCLGWDAAAEIDRQPRARETMTEPLL